MRPSLVSSSLVSVFALGAVLVGCGGVEADETVAEDVATSAEAMKCRHGRPNSCARQKDAGHPLRGAACESDRLVGTAVQSGALANDAAYKQLLAAEFNYVTPENEMKWGSLQPADGQNWNFGPADAIVAAARANRQDIKGHTLVWHSQLPAWVNDSLSARDLRRAIDRNIEKVVGRYRGVVDAWDVVNEALADDGTLRDSVFSRKLGEDFIADAFEKAHDVDRKAKLYYNDYGVEIPNAKSDAMYKLVKKLKRKGVPIDGVGFQMHIDATRPPTEAQLRANFERFDDLGLSINVSELDVQVRNVIGTRAYKLALQKQIYHRVVWACLKTPGCDAITTWGFTDRYSWIDSTFGADDPLQFDDALQRKPAYYGMIDGFTGLRPDAEGVAPNLIANASFETGSDGWFGFGIPSVDTSRRNHTGEQGGRATGRADTWQGPATDVTSLVQAGWVYDASAFASVSGSSAANVNLTAKITCEGEASQFVPLASASVNRHRFTELAGALSLPLCTLTEVVLYLEGPAAGVDILVDDVALRQRSEPLGPNVVSNGDFEAGTAGWVAWAGTLAASNVTHGGTGSVVVTNRTDTWQGPVHNLLPEVTRGATYKIGGFVRIGGAPSATVNLTLKSTCNGTEAFTPIGTVTANNTGFVAVGGSYLVPACANLTELVMYFEGPPAGVDLYADDVSVQQRLSIPVVPIPVPTIVNILGNGGFELGAGGWQPFGSPVAQTTAFVHSGSFAGVSTPRTASWQGPSHVLPAGPGTYDVSLYALQNSGANLGLSLTLKLTCGGADSFVFVAGAASTSGTWTKLQGSATIPANCTAAVVYVQQTDGSTFPDLYVDDLVASPVNVTNLSASPGFELGTTGWQAFGASLSQTNTVVRSGSFAGLSSGRTADWQGPSFLYPTGAGKYSASIYARQDSGADLTFLLSAKLTCGGSDSFPTLASAVGTSGAWTPLAGQFTVPAGCTSVQIYVHQAGGSTFPNIAVDDLVALPVP